MTTSLKKSGLHGQHSMEALVVHSTWNEERTSEYPQVEEYRSEWQALGFETRVTPNHEIRQDILRLVNTTRGNDRLLHIFDSLGTTNMQFDFWRYAKLYLEGGLYADVDVQPHSAILKWQLLATEQVSVVLFEESPEWMTHSTLIRWMLPWISNYQQLPSYASCLVISPEPRAHFFLDLLHAVDPNQWKDVSEPRKTLMTVGPGHLTDFVTKHREKGVLVATRSQGQQVYNHVGFGTWKPGSTLWFERLPQMLLMFSIGGILILSVAKKISKQSRRTARDSPSRRKLADWARDNDKCHEEEVPFILGDWESDASEESSSFGSSQELASHQYLRKSGRGLK